MLSIFLGSVQLRGARGGPAGGWGPAWALILLIWILTAAPAAAAQVEHRVSKGQTLVAIAKRHGTTVDAIREVNGLKPWQRIHPGLVLIIPERDKEAEAPKKGTERRKDTERRKSGAAKDDPPAPGKPGDKGKRAEKERKGDADRKGGVDRKGSAGRRGDADRKDKAKSYARKPKQPGFVHMVRNTEQLDVQLLTRDGRLVPKALPKLSRLLRANAGASIPIDPRLATLIGMVSNHFGGRTIRVVSGYRPYSPSQYTPHSNHNVGRAMDFLVEGVPNTVVRDFCRSFNNAGVGYYPYSTFVHLDARSSKVYWVDYSRPGEAPRYEGLKGRVTADEAARDVASPTDDSTQENEGGSKTTPPPQKQPIELKEGNQDSGRSISGDPQKGGQNQPIPSATPARSPHGTPAQERE